jgi:uncharacterized protein DUF5677
LIRSATFVARRLKRAIEKLGVYPSGIACSFVPFTIVSKAFSVQEAVLTLCKAGFGSEGYALSRTMVEMYIGLRWMTNQDQNKRCEEYVHFVAARRKLFANSRETFYPTDPKTAEIVKYVDRVFGEHAAKYQSPNFWANVNQKLWGMATEPEVLYNVPLDRNDLQWDYKYPYTMASDHVHATIEALMPLVPIIGEPFTVRDSRRSSSGVWLTHFALVTSTFWLLYIVARVDAWRDLGIEKEIDAASRPFEKIAGMRRRPYLRSPRSPD